MNKISDKTLSIVEKDEKYASFSTRIKYYPLVVSRAKGCMVEDSDGNTYIDFLSSAAVVNVGHNHPAVVKAIHDQVDKFIHYTPANLYHEPHADLMEKLAAITPGSFEKRVSFALSGSESSEGAIKAAKAYTGRNKILSFLRSYHGTTLGSLSVSGFNSSMHRQLGTMIPDVEFVPYPDCYRCPFGQKKDSCRMECVRYIENIFQTVLPPDETAAVIYEVIQGDGGVITGPAEFFQALHKICRENGILMIADEVQTGFGQTGRMFASEYLPFEPDLMVLGKALAAGMPLSAVVGRKEILESWTVPMHFFNSAGNPVSCAAALASIKVIEEERLTENAARRGDRLIERFEQMQRKYECIGDIRGTGLLIGVDIVKDRISRERDLEKTAKICWRCYEKGMILVFFSDSVLRVSPPLIITGEELEKAADIIEEAIDDVENGLVPDSVLDRIKGW